MASKKTSRAVIGSLATAALVAGMTLGSVARADDDNDLTPQDSMVTTIIDKSVINGGLMHDDSGNLVYDNAGNARFAYTGDIFALKTNGHNGELKKLGEKIGTIKGEAAFPKDFVAMSAGVNALMDSMMNGTWDGKMPKMPSVVPWTCNHCYMVVDDSTYVSIVDALDPASPFYSQAMADKFDAGLMDGAAGALANMRMQGRAFTGLTPASFDPVTKTMSVRMAGCSALVAISGSHAGKVGTLCMNSTATFNVSGAKAVFDANYNLIGYEPDSQITANGSSNCITVLHKPTM